MKYELLRSKRRTLAIEITAEAQLVVRAPKHLSKREIDKFVIKKQDWIESKMERREKYLHEHPEPTEEQRTEYIDQAVKYLPQRVEYWANIMGLYPTGIKITSAKKRFGSCSSKNSLCFSWRLMSRDEKAIDYVVVHELAHIRHKNHGKQFYELIESVMPDYKQRIELLKK